MSDFLLALQDVHVNFPARKNWLGKVTERVHALNGLDLQIRGVKRWGLLANPAVEKYAGATVDGHVETQSGKLFSPW